VDVTLLYLVSVTSLATMSLVTGGASESGVGIRGRLRALATVIVCELPAACALGAVVLSTGSVRASDIAAAQAASQGSVLETGGVPWHWNAVKSPLLFALFACFFLTVLVDGGSNTRSLQGADAQTAPAGVSFRRGAFLFAEWTNVLVMCAIGAVTFLGGWYVPGYAVHEHGQSAGLVALGIGCFLLKCWALAALVLLLRAALPLLSPAALMRAGYRALLPLAALGLGGAALVARYPMLPAVERATSFATLGALAVLLAIVGTSAIRRRAPSRALRRFVRVNTML
jgi:NADH-quinone oxidoreductase subunit H